MSTPKSSSWPLILIALAISGAGISYHFTLDSRFAAIEQKLDQNSVALQQYQISQETIVSQKNEALNNLSKEVDALQTSVSPLGKATKEQTDSLAEIRKQVASLDLLQQAQQDAQKKLADYAGQLEKIKHDVQMQSAQTQAPAAPPGVTIPAPAAAAPQLPSTHASTAVIKPPLPPRAESAVDLRPAEITMAQDASVRALPVALPVNLSDNH